ncbi:MAG: 50S ribosomal protein L9 [Microbacteriaceae bacterium]|jgi:large subunit ribosomal protein L9|nr:MAG: 50S ribosomal protein L9 [Microbacteriaceae bacterium BACL25 MAG-120322-bin65]HAA79858.1 50S ribosomal protein L9 [Microbacteriaceae bacterium]|tara:strand:+ start:2040 stop:2492 length:453 start_codon:yes stop_codon:yes gene_type:complete
MAKLILTNEVTGLGSPGDVVDVKNGYARNFLIPLGFAVTWSNGGQKQVDQIKNARAAKVLASQEEADALKAALEKATISIKVRAGKEGRLFGSVTRNDVLAAIEAAGIKGVDKRSIELSAPIKAVGAAEALIAIHAGVVAKVKLSVIAEK